MVAASKYATTTHDTSARPPRELPTAGNALARIVWSAAARNIATMTPGNTRRKACFVLSADTADALLAVARTGVSLGMVHCSM